MHIVLIGDSILDNAPYVDQGYSVVELLRAALPASKVNLLAVDGSLTIDISRQLQQFAADATHVFVSCGGNDAIDNIDVLREPVACVEEALERLSVRVKRFRGSFSGAIDAVSGKHDKVAAFTVYNKVPGLNNASRTALALFNEVILEELSHRQMPVIDLRVIFCDEQDYAPVSPIEPSVHGGRKIVARIVEMVRTDAFGGGLYV